MNLLTSIVHRVTISFRRAIASPSVHAFAIGVLAVSLARPVMAAPPSPITSALFSFPGSVAAGGSASSVSLAQADRWLGDEPFDNPAFGAERSGSVTPVLLHMSRQDLRADNRHYDEQSAFFDAAGGWIGSPLGAMSVSLYAYHPVLRREENAFERGERGGPTAPAVVQSGATLRELRAGLAVSTMAGPARLGVAGEWTRRDDQYHYVEQSGAPESGDRTASFSGGGWSAQAGARWDVGDGDRGAFSLGAGVRYLPSLTVDGSQVLDILTGFERNSVHAERDAGWEGGLSARYAITTQFRVLAAWGGRTAQDWKGFGVTSGTATSWSMAGDFHDARDPWTLRFGVGEERQAEVPELHAGLLGVGLGWSFDRTRMDLGIMRRGIQRRGHPTSFDDRVLGSLVFRF